MGLPPVLRMENSSVMRTYQNPLYLCSPQFSYMSLFEPLQQPFGWMDLHLLRCALHPIIILGTLSHYTLKLSPNKALEIFSLSTHTHTQPQKVRDHDVNMISQQQKV